MSNVFGGNLLLLDKLAAGGMGEVFRAKQIGAGGFEKIVAVKRILPQFANRTEFERMFRNEMNLCAHLQHSNIVQVFSNGQDGDYIYLVMEFVDGKNAAELLSAAKKNRTRIPIEFSCFIIAEAAKGLHHAHTYTDESTGKPINLVHRDISPQNIMFSYGGNVKVCDFGIAKVADRNNTTRPGDLKGKVPYVSPEHIDGLPLDARADVFSLGVVLYELLAQRSLFAGPSSFETLKNIKEKPIPALSEMLPDVPPELERIVLRALSRDREQRFPSAEALYRELMMFLNRYFPAFAQPDFSKFLKHVFRDKIESEQLERKSQLGQVKLSQASNGFGVHVESPSEATVMTGVQTGLRKATRFFVVSLLVTVLVGVGAMLTMREFFVEARPPASIPGLVTWLQADHVVKDGAGKVSEWKDQGSGKNDLQQIDERRRPELYEVLVKGHPALHFDGEDDFLEGNGIAAVLQRAPTLSVITVARASADGDQYQWSVHKADRATDVVQMGFGFGQLLRLKIVPSAEDNSYLVSERVDTSQFAVYSTVVDAAFVQLYRNGRQLIRAKLDGVLQLGDATTFSVGQEYDGGVPSDFFQGDIAELALYRVALSADSRAAVERYLAKKYGIEF